MKINWKQWEIAPDDHQFGHGILFFDTCKPRGNNLVAWSKDTSGCIAIQAP